MSTLDSILGLLDKWPKWKRITESPERIDKLESRLAALERKITRVPGETCPSCGEQSVRAISSRPHPQFGDLGAKLRTVKCEECGFTEDQMVKP